MAELIIKALYRVRARRAMLTPGPSTDLPCPYLVVACVKNNRHDRCQSESASSAFGCVLPDTFNDTST